MPIFEYVCQQCEYYFEALIMGRQRTKCPRCGSVKLERQVEMFAQGRPEEQVRGLNTNNVIAHARALLGNIPTIPRYKTKGMGSPGRRSPRSTVARIGP
jgi:putative FmdB family regulatory protein